MVIMEEKAWDARGICVHVNHVRLQNYTIGTSLQDVPIKKIP